MIDDGDVRVFQGDALEVLRTLPDRSVQMVASSPPFWGLRDYGTGSWEGGNADCDHVKAAVRTRGDDFRKRGEDRGYAPGSNFSNYGDRNATSSDFERVCGKCGAVRKDQQIGLEETPDEWCARLVAVYRECRRVLRDDGVMFIEIGDSYAQAQLRDRRETQPTGANGTAATTRPETIRNVSTVTGDCKPKDLVGQPWLLAFALRADGWYLRSEIIWSRPNPMPESVTDRPTKSHSTVFLLAKGQRKTRVVGLSDLDGKRVHLGQNVGAKNADLWAHEFGVRLAATILDGAQREQKFRLPSLDAEVWKQSLGSTDGYQVAGLPVEHRAAAFASRLLSANAPAKEFLCELDRMGVALADRDEFLILGGEAEFALPPGVDRYGERAIAIHDSGEIGEIDFTAHTLKYSRPSGCSYFYDADAIREPHVRTWDAATNGGSMSTGRHDAAHIGGSKRHERAYPEPNPAGANARSVWQIATEPTPFAHFATWPQALVERMIKVGTREGDTVLDPFMGSGTTALVARRLGRRAVGVELNPDYLAIAARRLQQLSLFAPDTPGRVDGVTGL